MLSIPMPRDERRHPKSDACRTLTVEEFAVAVGVSRATAYRAVAAGQVQAKRLGKRWLIPREALEQFLAPVGA
jgi:excisionase family DNA binding protein